MSYDLSPKTPIEAAAATIAWHSAAAVGSPHPVTEAAKTAIEFHNALRGLDDEGDPAGMGMRHLLASLAEYAAFRHMDFDLLVMDVEAHAAIHGFSGQFAGARDEDRVPAAAGVRHLLLTLQGYAESNDTDFDRMAREAMVEVAGEFSPTARLNP